MRKVTFHEDADAEMNDAAHYYEDRNKTHEIILGYNGRP
jgi:hypothetical protein